MALTNLHTYPTTDAYQTDRNLSIKFSRTIRYVNKQRVDY